MYVHLMRRWFVSAGMAAGLAGGVAMAGSAQACQPSYVVAQGDTLFSIAEANLGDAGKWSLIFYANPALQGEDLMKVTPGLALTLPCSQEAARAPDPTPLQLPDAEMILVTRSNYAPFTDRDWPGQGMVTEIVNAALEASPDPVPYAITWEDDWSKQMEMMASKEGVDMGFPWFRPDCASTPETYRCMNFHFSEPLVDLAILLFSRVDAPLRFTQDSDLHGKTLCRPAGYFTHDLEEPGRDWLRSGLVKLEQPATPDDCFRMLVEGSVDAVAVNEFLGVQKMFELGLTEQVAALQRPLSVQGLHVLISKKHWRGTTHLYRFNAGLMELKKSDRYNEIVSRHLALFWDQVGN